jgi:hypothetical protein
MRASGNRLAASFDGVRASDAERDQAIGELRDRFAEGLLSHDTFLYRMDMALQAKDRAELSRLFADLPGPSRGAERQRRPLGEPANREPGDAEPGDGAGASAPGGKTSGRRGPGRPQLGRLVRARLARARQAAAVRLGGPSLTEPPQLCLPPQTGNKFTIGREIACDFTVADLSVSRWHARLHREEESWLLCDLGSTNGTRLNGWRVTTEVPVRPGDRVSFGAVTFVVIDHPAGPD